MSDEATLRALGHAIDSIKFHVEHLMGENPTALERSTLLVKLQSLQLLVQKFQKEKGL